MFIHPLPQQCAITTVLSCSAAARRQRPRRRCVSSPCAPARRWPSGPAPWRCWRRCGMGFRNDAFYKNNRAHIAAIVRRGKVRSAIAEKPLTHRRKSMNLTCPTPTRQFRSRAHPQILAMASNAEGSRSRGVGWSFHTIHAERCVACAPMRLLGYLCASTSTPTPPVSHVSLSQRRGEEPRRY